MLSYLRDIPAPDRTEWMGWAVLLTLAILNCFR